jgi:uncharacterized protein (UPF0264 family)
MLTIEELRSRGRTGLLVSVRDAAEASAALAGGADVIDVKEPSRGPLGAADRRTIEEVVCAVDRRACVTAAAGELIDASRTVVSFPRGVSFVKIGMAGCGSLCDWATQWQKMIDFLRSEIDSAGLQFAAVVYADWRQAGAPHPEEIHRAGRDLGCPVLLIDTWNKSGGTLLDLWSTNELRDFVDGVRDGGQAVVLAGSLSGASLLCAFRLQPELVAVRAAACDGGRGGKVSRARVAELKRALDSVGAGTPNAVCRPPTQSSATAGRQKFS